VIVKDKISVAYSTIDELLERKEIIEDRVTNYIKDNPLVADTSRSNIRISKDRFILEVELIKD
jgi:hypothetical protein